jgi:UDP-glucose 4-epimerase
MAAKARERAPRPKAAPAVPPRNVMITGVTGNVGRHLARHLASDPRIGVVLGTAPHPRPRFFDALPPERFRYVQADILRSRQVRDLFRGRAFLDAGIDTVVHLAFLGHPGWGGRKAYQLNVEGTKGLLDQCIESGRVRKFVFKSSDAVYRLGPSLPLYLDENGDLNHDPDADPWIRHRVAAEMICRSRMDAKEMAVVILRCASIIGGNVGDQRNAYFDGRVVFKALGFDPLINLVHVADVIEAVRLAVFRDVGSGIFNIAGNDTATIRTFAESNGRRCVSLPEPLLPVVNWVQRKMGLTDYYYSVDRDRMRYACLLDTGRAERVLGFRPQRYVEFREHFRR